MPKHIQVRDVPDHIHRKLKAQAALEGKSLSDYLREEIRLIVNRPTMEELAREIKALGLPDPGESAADAIRAEREGR